MPSKLHQQFSDQLGWLKQHTDGINIHKKDTPDDGDGVILPLEGSNQTRPKVAAFIQSNITKADAGESFHLTKFKGHSYKKKPYAVATLGSWLHCSLS